MTNINKNIIKNILKDIKDINTNKDIVTNGTLKDIIIDNNLISIILHINYEKELYQDLINNCERLLQQYNNKLKYNILLTV